MEPSRILWQKDGVFAAKRIPGILLTPAGTVLWWCEARDTLSDWARIDLQLYRSEDGGKSFSEPLTLASGDAEHPTVNNPVLIAARDGTLFFLYCRDYSVDGGDVFLRVSRDDGRTWTEPRDLMSSTRPAEHNAFAFGPGHGIETPDGTLLCPVWYVKKSAGMEPRSHHPAVVSSFFSRDGGGSWTLGEEIPATADCPDPNETAAAILSELGPKLDAFPTESHFVSYIGVAPALGKSAGKNVSSRKKHKNTSRVGIVLKMAASTLSRSESSLGARYRCVRSRTCSRTAIKDVAREMAKRIYRGIKHGQAYIDEGERAYLERTRERTIKSMKKKISKLGISAEELGIYAVAV